jgi:hypothetical protein
VTTAGFVSGIRGDDAPTRCSRVAAVASLLLALTVVATLPVTSEAASYVGVLAASVGAVIVVAGTLLWSRPTLVVRSVAALAAGAILVGDVLNAWVGIPGAHELEQLTRLEAVVTLGLPGLVLLLLLADALRRRPEPAPERPYAL